MSVTSDMIELGLTKLCAHFQVESEPSGETYKVFCRRPTTEIGGYCNRHSEERALVDQAKTVKKAAALVEKARLEEEILPKASKRIESILDNEDAKDADVIKIWQTTMDRIGLAAVQGIVVDGEVRVDAPMDILRRMLTPPPAMELDDVVEAEIVPPDQEMIE